MKNKRVLIIGGTDGIGRAIANKLVKENTVLIVGLNEKKAKDFITTNPKNGKYIVHDASLLNNIPKLHLLIKSALDGLDFIVHTADVLQVKRINTSEGLDRSIALCYFSRVLINQLFATEGAPYKPEKIIHVALAGHKPSKNFAKNFPLSDKAGGIKMHSIGQISNDFYALYMKEKFDNQRIKINILNPGFVSTNIRNDGQFPSFVKKIIFPLLHIIWKKRERSPKEYAEIPIAILLNKNDEANKYTLIDENGRGLEGSENVRNSQTQRQVYNHTTQIINDLLEENKIESWL
ncbi:MAG: SDR family NAD(P)-dependent oxidoreductase [Thermonemataceae bacterium]